MHKPNYSVLEGSSKNNDKPDKISSVHWWADDPYEKLLDGYGNVKQWLACCAYNPETGRFHIPMMHLGRFNTLVHDWLRQKEYDAVIMLNVVFKDKRGGFYDTAWDNQNGDFWLVCDDYLERFDPTKQRAPKVKRKHTPADTHIVSGCGTKLINYLGQELPGATTTPSADNPSAADAPQNLASQEPDAVHADYFV